MLQNQSGDRGNSAAKRAALKAVDVRTHLGFASLRADPLPAGPLIEDDSFG
jgi:hypothetical protein